MAPWKACLAAGLGLWVMVAYGSPAAEPFDFRHGRPMAFLDYLKGQTHGDFFVRSSMPGWVRKEDVPALIAAMDSDEPCAPVTMYISSYLRDHSTVGDEAVYLIEGFRAGTYPPRLNSAPATAQKKQEIRAWWKHEQDGAKRAH